MSDNENKRLAKIKEQEVQADAVIAQLERFPVRPYGTDKHRKRWNRADACEFANRVIRRYSDKTEVLSVVARRLKEKEDRYDPDEAHTNTPLVKLQNTVVFVYERGDATEVLLSRLDKYFTSGGRGNRAKVEALSRMVRVYIDFELDGQPLPLTVILPDHLKYRAFRYALIDDNFHIGAGLGLRHIGKKSKEDIRRRSAKRLAELDKGERRALHRAAWRRLKEAGEIFNSLKDQT